ISTYCDWQMLAVMNNIVMDSFNALCTIISL
ncbi:hypothetical protein Tsp_05303, partial [Trichinella spiralis]